MDGLVDHGQELELNVIDYFNLTHDARSNGDLKDIEIAQRKFNEIFSILRENFDEEMLHLKTLNVTSAVKSADILDFYNLIQEKGCKNCFVHELFYAYTFSYRDTVYDIHIESNRGNFRDCAISLSAPQLELLIVANMDGLIDHSQGTEPSYRGHFSFNEGNERLIYGDVQKFLKVQRKFNSLFFFLRQRLEEEI
jgi:hypothetical protein